LKRVVAIFRATQKVRRSPGTLAGDLEGIRLGVPWGHMSGHCDLFPHVQVRCSIRLHRELRFDMQSLAEQGACACHKVPSNDGLEAFPCV